MYYTGDYIVVCFCFFVVVVEWQVEREARCAAMEADRAVNLVEHTKEIHSRPARQWIVSEHRKAGSPVK